MENVLNCLTDTEKETVKNLVNNYVVKNIRILNEEYLKDLNKTDEEILLFFNIDYINHLNSENDNKRNTILIEQIHDENLENVLLLLKAGADPNKDKVCSYEEYVNTVPIIEAVKKNDLEIVKILVKYGADVNKFDMRDMSALQVASERGYIDIVKFLLQNNACDSLTYDDDYEEYLGSKSLHSSLIKKHLNVSKELLKAGCGINFDFYCSDTDYRKIIFKHKKYKKQRKFIHKVRVLIILFNNL